MTWMPYEQYLKLGWVEPEKVEPKNKFFTGLEAHQQGKALYNIKWGWPKHAAVHPDFLKDYISKNGPYLYHGTTAKALRPILSEGLYPQERHPHEPIEHWDARPGHVYLGTRQYVNGGYFSDRFQHKLLKVDLRQLDPSKITADEDHWNARMHDDLGASQTVQRAWQTERPPQNTWPTDDSMGSWANRVGIGDHPGETEYSLGQGSLAYNGSIPPSAITHEADAVAGRQSATDAKNFEAKLFHHSERGLLRKIDLPFMAHDKPHPTLSNHPVSITLRHPVHVFAPMMQSQIDAARDVGSDGVVSHTPDGMSVAVLDQGAVVPGHDHEFPY